MKIFTTDGSQHQRDPSKKRYYAIDIGVKNQANNDVILKIPVNRVLKNKNQAVRQGARRCDKRSIFEHM
jgi:hypothetical protein